MSKNRTQDGDTDMNTLHFHFQLGTALRAILAWLADTTQESRSARLSTMGMAACRRDGYGFEHPGEDHRFR
jgi:hypothetical protein